VDKQVSAQPIRVLHVVDTLNVGGIQTALLNFVERTMGPFQHAVCCIREGGPVARRLGALGVPVHCVGKRDGHDWGVMFRIARLCRSARPHVVHTRNWGAIDGIIGARLAGVPAVIHSEHGLSNVDPEHYRRRVGRRLLVPLVDQLVAVSDHLRCRLRDEVGVDTHKITLVRNGVDLIKFEPGMGRAARRGAAGYCATDVVVGTVGRLVEVKDHRGLLEAFRRVSAHHPACHLIIIGDGPERGALESQIRQWGLGDRVRLVGYTDDVAAWLSILDLFVLASHLEGTSNALLEAMAAGLPVVATRVGGNAEVVVDGVTGRLVPAGDMAALAAALEAYSRDADARRQHGAAGRDWVAEHYPIDAMIAGLAAVYRDAVARRR
jgi:sugar transferase (PEP-CTERM/EpsH1 system associated)